MMRVRIVEIVSFQHVGYKRFGQLITIYHNILAGGESSDAVGGPFYDAQGMLFQHSAGFILRIVQGV